MTAHKENSGAGLEEDVQLVCCRLHGEEFCIDITKVREIVRLPEITTIPRTPEYIRGIANLRGNVLPVIDGRLRFNLPSQKATERTRVLVLDIDGLVTGLVVDEVSEVMLAGSDVIEAPPAMTQGGIAGEYLSGVLKLDNGNRLILMINPEEVINTPDMANGQTAGELSGPSAAHAAADSGRKDMAEERQLVSFALGDEEYAFEIHRVKEILRKEEITAVPNADPAVKGLLTVRNALLPILDLRIILGMEEDERDEQRILVVEQEDMAVGLLIDKVNEVVRVHPDLIAPADRLVADNSELESVARLENGKRLIMILDNSRLVDLATVSDLLSEGQEMQELEGERQRSVDMDEEQLVTFLVGGEEYGIRITSIQEINRLTEVTRLPRSPKFMAGITNLRGQVVPLVDLRTWFGLPAREAEERTRVIIVDLNGQRTGFIVDQVNEVLRIPLADIETTPEIVAGSEAERSAFLTGIGKIDNGRRMILLLDIGKLLSKGEQETLARFRDKQPAPTKAATSKKRSTKTKTAAPKKSSTLAKTKAASTKSPKTKPSAAKTAAKPAAKKKLPKKKLVIEE